MATANGNKRPAKAAHVNLMTDTILQNIPPDGLRAVMRSILVDNPSFTAGFHLQSARWLQKTQPTSLPELFISTAAKGPFQKPTVHTSPLFENLQSRIRAMYGSGLGFESLSLLSEIVKQASELEFDENTQHGEDLMDLLSTVDGDIVQAVTAAGKELITTTRRRNMNATEIEVQNYLQKILEGSRDKANAKGMEFLFERGLSVAEINNF